MKVKKQLTDKRTKDLVRTEVLGNKVGTNKYEVMERNPVYFGIIREFTGNTDNGINIGKVQMAIKSYGVGKFVFESMSLLYFLPPEFLDEVLILAASVVNDDIKELKKQTNDYMDLYEGKVG